MYNHYTQGHVTTTTSTPGEWRPDPKTSQSPRWSHSQGLEQSYPSPMSDTPNSPLRSSLYPEATSSAAYPRSFPLAEPPFRAYPAPTPAAVMEGPMIPASPLYQQAPYGQDPRSYYPHPHPPPPPPSLRPEMQQRPPATQYPLPPQSFQPYLPTGPPLLPGLTGSQTLMPAAPAYQHVRSDTIYQQGPTSLSSASAPRSQKTTRRTKAHVAKACQNCKKAHLSCDEARPCARCVASGKQSTCVDVEHKKRGRPMLRDDREQRLEAAAAAAAASRAGPAVTGPDPSIARGHRRGDSLRVLRSSQYGSGSDDSRPSTSQGADRSRPLVPTAAFPSPYSAPRSAPSQLCAFLNLDLHFLKASEPLRALLGGTPDIIDRPLIDYVAPQFQAAVQRVQNELRDERARREPTYLPAIYPEQQERAAVRDHEPDSADNLSAEYQDRNDVYTFRTASRQLEQFQVRIRLARTSTFFATMTLQRVPPLQAAIAPSPYARTGQYAIESSPAQSPYCVSNPESPFSTMPGALMTTLPPPTSIPPHSSVPPTYVYGAQPQTDLGYFGRQGMQPPPAPQQYAPPSAQQYAPPTPYSSRDRSSTAGSSRYLPPLVSSAPTTPSQFGEAGPAIRSSSRRRSPEQLRDSDEEEDGRKRRRLNIQDIVER